MYSLHISEWCWEKNCFINLPNDSVPESQKSFDKENPIGGSQTSLIVGY